MGKIDLEYFTRRMREEQDAADRATPVASAIHRELAEKYAMLADDAKKSRRSPFPDQA